MKTGYAGELIKQHGMLQGFLDRAAEEKHALLSSNAGAQIINDYTELLRKHVIVERHELNGVHCGSDEAEQYDDYALDLDVTLSDLLLSTLSTSELTVARLLPKLNQLLAEHMAQPAHTALLTD